MFIWSEKFETKIELVDSQHKNLVEIINKLAETANRGEADESVLDSILEELMAYADKHFVDEELMTLHAKIDKRHRNMHRMQHQSFIYDIQRMRSHISQDDTVAERLGKLAQFATSWLMFHILGEDMLMAKQIRAIEQGVSPEQAFENGQEANHDAETTRMLLNAVMDMWRGSVDRCTELEGELAKLNGDSL